MKKLLTPLLLLLLTVNAKAATLFVTNTNDSGAGSLRNTVLSASSGDVIKFLPSLLASGSQTIYLSSQINLDKSLSIVGLYNATDTLYLSSSSSNPVNGLNYSPNSMINASIDSIFFVGFSDAVVFGFQTDSVIVKNSFFQNCLTGINFASVFTSTPRKIINSEFNYNEAGITVSSTSNSNPYQIDISNCTFNKNYGLGIRNIGNSIVRSEINVSTSTFHDNGITGDTNTGAVLSSTTYIGGTGIDTNNVTLINTTFIDNGNNNNQIWLRSESDYSNLSLASSIIFSPIFNDNALIVNSSGYNVFSALSITGSNVNDQLGVSLSALNLGPLQNNGGVTKTMEPQLTSAAVDMGDPVDFTSAQNSLITDVRRDAGAAENVGGSGTSSIDEEEIILNIHAYPNPANSFITLEVENRDFEFATISILGLDGSLIKNYGEFNRSNTRLNIESLSNGVFLIKVNTKIGSHVISFVKQ